MGAFAGTGRIKGKLWHDVPLEEGKELTVALHDGLMFLHQGQSVLVKRLRFWYDRHGKLTARASRCIE